MGEWWNEGMHGRKQKHQTSDCKLHFENQYQRKLLYNNILRQIY